jgi:hypothetical protein
LAVSDEPAPFTGPQLTREGVVEGKPATAATEPAPATPPAKEEPLELVERPPRGDRDFRLDRSYRSQPGPPRRRRWPLVLALPVVAAVGLVAWVVSRPPPKVLKRPDLPSLPADVKDALPVLAGPPIVIDSTPSGAAITLPDGMTLGTTPWAGNNPFLTPTTVTLRLSGYRPATLQVPGAKEATLHATLRPR